MRAKKKKHIIKVQGGSRYTYTHIYIQIHTGLDFKFHAGIVCHCQCYNMRPCEGFLSEFGAADLAEFTFMRGLPYCCFT